MKPGFDIAVSVIENHVKDITDGRYGNPMGMSEAEMTRLLTASENMARTSCQSITYQNIMEGRPTLAVATGEALRIRLANAAYRDRN